MNFLMALLMCLITPVAFAGIKDGGGGSGVVAEFISMGKDLVKRVEANRIDDLTAASLLETVKTTKVVAKKDLILNGNAVDAINYPSRKLIEVSRPRWEKLSAKPWLQLQLVFHEYLGIMRIDDSDYRVSSKILSSDLCSRTPAFVAAAEDELSRPCDNIGLQELFYLKKLSIKNMESFSIADYRDIPNLISLEVNSSTGAFALSPQLTKLLPKLTSIDIDSSEVRIAAKTFVNLKLNYLAVSNIRVEKNALKGLNARMLTLRKIPEDQRELNVLAAELQNAQYDCAIDKASDSEHRHMFCLKK